LDLIEKSVLINIDNAGRANTLRKREPGPVPSCPGNNRFHTLGNKQLKAQQPDGARARDQGRIPNPHLRHVSDRLDGSSERFAERGLF
jgi:hypothetical protein